MTAKKASIELRDENKVVSSSLKELKANLKELKEKHDKLGGYTRSSTLDIAC